MIRQTISRTVVLALLGVAGALSGCVSVQTTGGRVTYWTVPGMDSGDRSNRAGTTYYNQRWATYPDTHPAVAGKPRSEAGAPSPAAGDVVQNGSGSRSQADDQMNDRLGAAPREPAGTKPADPCQPGANAGSLWGALAGGLLGSMFGGGHMRDFFIVLGASGGALRGTEMWDDSRRCR